MMHRWTVPLACLAWLAVGSATASAAGEAPIQLQLSPRICTLAARDNTLVPLMWIQAVGPGLVCGWLLLWRSLGPLRLRPLSPAAP